LRLEGKPLPASLYLVPAPAPSRFFDKAVLLYAGPIIAGLAGWLLGGDQIIQPSVDGAYVWIPIAASAFFHSVYIFVISYYEMTYPYFGFLGGSASFRSYLNVWWGVIEWGAVIITILFVAIELITFLTKL
jgi:hypothetical protein